MNSPATGYQASLGEFLDWLQCGAALIHRSGRVIRVNDRLAELMQTEPQALRGAELHSLYARPEDQASLHEILAGFDAPREREFYLPLPDGRRLPVIASGRRLPVAADGDVRLVTFMDLSGQKRAEQRAREQYQAVLRLSDTLLSQALALNEKSQALAGELAAANMDSIYMLAMASEAKDTDTGLHIRRIQFFTEALARAIGVEPALAEKMGYSAVLHDVGKLLVPDEVLKKPGPLTDEERRTMELHTIAGESMLSNRPFFDIARQIARSHHENWNGDGYPDRLAGEEIPLAARIVRVVDAFDALASDRVYKDAMSERDSLQAVVAASGADFDPALVPIFQTLVIDGRVAAVRSAVHEALETGDWTPVRKLIDAIVPVTSQQSDRAG